MGKYIVEMLIVNEDGGLEDVSILVLAQNAKFARAAAEKNYPEAAIGYVGAA